MDLSTQIARRIAEAATAHNNRVIGGNITYGIGMCEPEFKAIIEAELDPVMEVLRESIRHSYIVGVDNPESGRALICEACFMKTTFAYEDIFDAKDMRHTDCRVSRARRIVGEVWGIHRSVI